MPQLNRTLFPQTLITNALITKGQIGSLNLQIDEINLKSTDWTEMMMEWC